MGEDMICAEMSCNHAGDFKRAQDIVRAARWAGADAVKLQCWSPDTMVPDDGARAPAPWQHLTLFELYRQAFTPWEWLEPLRDQILQAGMRSVVSVFDEGALNFCWHRLGGWDLFKVASPEATDTALLEAVGAANVDVVISGGSLTGAGLQKAVRTCLDAGAKSAIPCWCVSKYPAHPSEFGLTEAAVRLLEWGLSDHSRGIGVSVAAAALGATYIERHLTLERDFPTLDASFSLRPTDLRRMVKACHEARAAVFGSARPVVGMKRTDKGRVL